MTLLVLAVGVTAQAAEVLLGPDDAAERALSRSPAAQAAHYEHTAAQAATHGAWAFALPQVQGVASADRAHVDRPESAPGYGAQVRVQQHVYTPGRWDGVSLSTRADRDAAQASVDATRRDVALRARLAVERVRLAHARLEVLTERKHQREDEQSEAEALFAAGRTTVTEARQAMVATQLAEDARLAGENDVAAARRELAAAVDTDESVDARGTLTRPENLADALAQARLVPGAEQRRLEAEARSFNGSLAQTAAGGAPQLYAVSSAGASGGQPDALHGIWDWSAGLEVRWSFYDGGARSATDEQLHARAAARLASARAVDRDRRALLDALADELPILARRLDLADRTVAAAQESYADTRERFRAGRLKILDVGQAGLTVQESELGRAQLIAREAELAHRLRALAE